MSWQDGLLMVGSAVLGLGLWPSIRGPHKPAVWTSAITTAVLVSYGVAYITLHLWGATAGIAVNALGWAILLAQRIRQ
jgi:hypothetical protein